MSRHVKTGGIRPQTIEEARFLRTALHMAAAAVQLTEVGARASGATADLMSQADRVLAQYQRAEKARQLGLDAYRTCACGARDHADPFDHQPDCEYRTGYDLRVRTHQ